MYTTTNSSSAIPSERRAARLSTGAQRAWQLTTKVIGAPDRHSRTTNREALGGLFEAANERKLRSAFGLERPDRVVRGVVIGHATEQTEQARDFGIVHVHDVEVVQIDTAPQRPDVDQRVNPRV